MLIATIEGATHRIGKSQGYLGLPVRLERINCAVNGPDTPSMTTAWHPTPAEIDAIRRGAAIHVTLLGTAHPPITLSVGPEPEE